MLPVSPLDWCQSAHALIEVRVRTETSPLRLGSYGMLPIAVDNGVIRTKDSRTAPYVCADYSDMMNRTLACVVLNRYSSVVAIKRKASSVIDPMDAPG
jgi:hypothetical protein